MDQWLLTTYERRRKIIMFNVLPRTNKETVFPLVKRNVQNGSIIMTDESPIYSTRLPNNGHQIKPLLEHGFFHETVHHKSGQYVRHVHGWEHGILHISDTN